MSFENKANGAESEAFVIPEDRKLASPGVTPLGGDQTIEAVMNKKGDKVESYIVRAFDESGVSREFRLDKKRGDDLINSRISSLSSLVSQQRMIDDEAFQALMPTYVAEAYVDKLRQINTPEELIPKTTHAIIDAIIADLNHYKELGQAQIGLEAQRFGDLMLKIGIEVLEGDNFKYNNLPPAFKQHIDDSLPILKALMAQHAGVTEETFKAAERLYRIKRLEGELKYAAFLKGADETTKTAGTLLGNLIGPAAGAIKATGDAAYEATMQKLKELKEKASRPKKS